MDDVNSDIRKLLQELEDLVKANGDEKTGQVLGEIRQSRDPLETFRKALKGVNVRTCSEREEWFKAYRNGALSSDQVKFLTFTTDRWELGEKGILIISAYARRWRLHPWEFWDGPPPSDNLLQQCYTDSKIIREVVPLRAQVISFTVAGLVEDERNKLKQQQGFPASDATSGRDQVCLSQALTNICHQHYGVDPGKRKWLQEEYNAGTKSLNLENPEVMLSLRAVKTSAIKRHNWTRIEVDALNDYVKTLPQAGILGLLKEAWDSVVEYQKPQSRKRQRQDDNVAESTNQHRTSAGMRPTLSISRHDPDAVEGLVTMPNGSGQGSSLFMSQDHSAMGSYNNNNKTPDMEVGDNYDESTSGLIATGNLGSSIQPSGHRPTNESSTSVAQDSIREQHNIADGPGALEICAERTSPSSSTVVAQNTDSGLFIGQNVGTPNEVAREQLNFADGPALNDCVQTDTISLSSNVQSNTTRPELDSQASHIHSFGVASNVFAHRTAQDVQAIDTIIDNNDGNITREQPNLSGATQTDTHDVDATEIRNSAENAHEAVIDWPQLDLSEFDLFRDCQLPEFDIFTQPDA